MAQTFPPRMRAIASATYLSSTAPQTLILEPGDDGLIPAAGVYHVVAQARAVGVDVTLVRIPFASQDHARTTIGHCSDNTLSSGHPIG